MRTSTTIDGITVSIGDYVGFKSDIEQSGRIKAINGGDYGICLTLESEFGFDGDYIGGDTITEVQARDCWVD